MSPEPLDRWVDRQRRRAVAGLLRHVSPVGIVKPRPDFGQTIHPVTGSVVASVSLGDYDPEPDYFFHWLRDSATVTDALRELAEAGDPSADWRAILADVVAFSHHLATLDGRPLAGGAWRDRVAPAMRVHVRSDDDLARATGEAILGDVRYNPDGTVDIKHWARPQNDGPALRALSMLRWLASPALGDGPLRASIERLVDRDLEFVARHAGEPCYDLWEEVPGRHYYTEVAQWAALADGARFATGDEARADRYAAAAERLATTLDASWRPGAGTYEARRQADPPADPDRLDAANLLAVLHAGRETGRHSVHDPRTGETLARLDALFADLYPINRDRPGGAAVVHGRFADDVYYGGNPWFITTLAAAEVRYRRAAALAGAERDRLVAEADAVLVRVREMAPDDGTLAEQFDRTTGAPVSAKDLAWSHAAVLSATSARAAVLGEPAPG